MSGYRTWQVRREGQISGPFPEKQVLQFIILGRIAASDEISMDGHFWNSFEQTPVILAELREMVGGHFDEDADPAWRNERLRAILRHADERKQPDPRSEDAAAASAAWAGRRSGDDRRKTPETVEQHSYRETVAEVDRSLQQNRKSRNLIAVALLALLLAVVWALYRYGAKDAKIDLGLRPATCESPPVSGINWRNCDKSGLVLAGADLRGADLRGTQFKGANLSYADLTGANVEGMKMEGAVLAGARWADGRRCAENSVGLCR